MKQGFGLIEIIIAVAVIALLGGGGLYWREAKKQMSLEKFGLEKEMEALALKEKIEKQNKQILEDSSSQQNQSTSENVDTSNWKIYRNEKYGFEFKYPAHLEKIGERSGVGTWEELINYDNKFDGTGDWTISSDSKEKVEKFFTCDALINNYLPLDFYELNLCKVVNINGQIIVYGVGLDKPFEGVQSLTSILIALKDKDFVLLTFVEEPVPSLPGKTKRIVDDFLKKYPNVEFPGEGFKELSRITKESLIKEIREPSKEITEGMMVLEKIAKTFKFTK